MFTRLSDIDRLFGTMNLLRNRLDNLYSDFDRSDSFRWAIQGSVPRTNLYEDGEGFEIRAEVPGLAKEDLKVNIQGNYLEISGTRSSDAPKGYRIHKTERGADSFSRSLTLPTDVDATKVEATLKNGILYLTLPKAEAVKPKKITIG
ncbi:MAG: Hsp20/alpha crystallin family protein [Proteobacteria bacterium]|nr:Hsp20/alpha crystallin family protein [Pseudomonadota bacterium]MBU1584524.1 Hsp20/alpha crystallin family protein [Pseudomonadota bacterium]MBU2451717.1 Hsp20/alpha crystallin family protein [Pseudomonadota bacterium]MBU2631542.1 Hsp20/alpha crystallin family protein [Pseudomonadota bacterium]